MTDLIDRIEAATGADRGLDAAIHIAANPDQPWIIGHEPGRFPREPIYGTLSDLAGMISADIAYAIGSPHYTASIDAAMGLVKAGVPWSINYPANDDGSRSCHGIPTKPTADVCGIFGRAATPALALCAAALKARESEG